MTADRDAERRWRMIVLLGGVLLLGVATVLAARKAAQGHSAFLRWQPQILALMQGDVEVYAHSGDPDDPSYPNTPIVGLLLYPLAAMPGYSGAVAFAVIKAVMAALAVWWAIGLAGGTAVSAVIDGRRDARPTQPPGWAYLVILILSARPILSDMQHGNINIILLFLVILALREFTRGRDVSAGLLLGLSVVMKVTPGLFLLYFLWKRAWGVLLWSAAGVAAAVLFPAVFLGPQTNLQLHEAWFERMIVPFVAEGDVAYVEHINQSIAGVMMRLMTDVPSVDTGDPVKIPVNVVSLDPELVQWLIRTCLIGVLAALAYICRTPLTDRRNWVLACEFGLIIIGMLILSERTWKHHFVSITLPVACVTIALASGVGGRAMRWYLGATLAAFFVLTVATSGEFIGWIHQGVAHKFVEAFGSFLLAALLLAAALATLILRQRRRQGTVTSSPQGGLLADPAAEQPDQHERRPEQLP